MKTYIKYIYLSLFLLLTVTADAQTRVIWLGKDVQTIQNSEILLASNLTVTSLGYPSWLISKSVQRDSGNEAAVGNMVSYGYPSWIISKDVRKNFRQPGTVKPQSQPVKEPAIASIHK